ncbi:nuclease-related domain-containing protein [Neobacillus sp. SuZ13]|uniref:nuclease-related domain-containing protein n=1 Tax=Neobacillus sp. SuZ13 TaxID=3047875 RepID=UPI0024BF9687|nr:nuclease-related domain-containing protein [Neobacillus sp. SuZ13]WHY69058.1 nuclease-related domain-containing protein [Neobacillus sp. SuZ13]
MAYKPRFESKELKILRVLNKRMMLSEKDKQHFFTLKKGFEGEVMFDKLTEELQCECYILNDLLFKVNNTLFQIDSLIITSGRIFFYEIKNFEGDYFIEPNTNRLYKKPKKEYNNPLLQLIRSDSLLRQLLQNIGYNLPIEAQVVFINPEFTLYQAPLDSPIIFPTQLNSYMRKLDAIPSKLNGKDKLLADKLISLHIEENPYTVLPHYEFKKLRKGITCAVCDSFSIHVNGKICKCGVCGHEELVTVAVLRNVSEIRLLFPEMRITTNLIYDWCMVIELKRTIKRILVRNYKQIGVRQWTYYE